MDKDILKSLYWTFGVVILFFVCCYTNFNGLIFFITLGVLLLCSLIPRLAKHAKDIVIKVGRKTLDICTALDVILCVIVIVIGFFHVLGTSTFIWWYVLGAIVVFLVTLLANYTLYLLIDIRDSLKKLADNIDKKGE